MTNRTGAAEERSAAKNAVCAFMAFTSISSFAHLVGASGGLDRLGYWQTAEALGNLTGFTLLAVKLLRPAEPLTWLYVFIPQIAFLCPEPETDPNYAAQSRDSANGNPGA